MASTCASQLLETQYCVLEGCFIGLPSGALFLRQKRAKIIAMLRQCYRNAEAMLSARPECLYSTKAYAGLQHSFWLPKLVLGGLHIPDRLYDMRTDPRLF